NIPVLDFTAPAPKELEEALDFIRGHLERKTPVYVHCALGRVRSAEVIKKFVAATNFFASTP
ncbi:MAG: dual specificity protein phosphatase family protein, partial [Planctomycetes bacterium]|nr:dual specificity protein phosphatase family protein [Planctomycetota bacterium]